MIDIKVNGISLPLPSDYRYSRQFETNIFDRDNNAYDFTLPVTIPLSDQTKKALGLPHIIANPNLRKDYDATLTVDGIFVRELTLRLINTSIADNTIQISLIGDYGTYSRIVGNTKVNELVLGGVRTIASIQSPLPSATRDSGGLTITYTPCDLADHMQDVADGTVTADYHFYQACDGSPNIDQIHKEQPYTGGSVVGIEEPRSIINPYHDDGGSNKGFIDVVRAYLESSFHDTANVLQTNDRFFNVPFFKLKYVMEHCFTEFGYTVDWGELNNVNFDSVTLYNTFAINKVQMTKIIHTSTSFEVQITHDATTITPQNHVPNQTIVEFLTEFGKLLNIQYVINHTAKSIKINLLKKLDPALGTVVDLTNRAHPDYEINFEQQDIFNGYEFGFKTDPNDGASGDMLEDNLGNYSYRGAVDHHLNLSLVPSPGTGDIAYVRCENAYHQYSGTGWWPFAHNLNSYATSDHSDLKKVEIAVTPVRMVRQHRVFRYTSANTGTFMGQTDATWTDNMLMPYSEIGMSGDNLLWIQKRQLDYNDGTPLTAILHDQSFGVVNARAGAIQPHVANYLGLTPCIATVATDFPCGSSTRWSTAGVLGKGENFYFESKDNQYSYGLYPEYWKGFVEKVSAGVQVKWKVMWDAPTNENTPLNEVYILIDGIYYLCRSAEIEAPYPEYAELTLVRI